MKITLLKEAPKPKGLVILPFFEEKELPIDIRGFKIPSVSSKLFSGKKDTNFVLENRELDAAFFYLGLGKKFDFKETKTAFRRVSSKQADLIADQITIVFQEEMDNLIFGSSHFRIIPWNLQIGAL
jgi:leucyl aminopeptidase